MSQFWSETGLYEQVNCNCLPSHRKRISNWSKSFLSDSVASSSHILVTHETDLIFSTSSSPRKIISDPERLFIILMGDTVIVKYEFIHHEFITPHNSANIESLIVSLTFLTPSRRFHFSNDSITSFCATNLLFQLHHPPIKNKYRFLQWRSGIYFTLYRDLSEKSISCILFKNWFYNIQISRKFCVLVDFLLVHPSHIL